MTKSIEAHFSITFIGAGNVAWHLAQAFSVNGYRIRQIYSRTIDSASRLAQLVNASATNNIMDIDDESDIYIYSLADDALQWAITELRCGKGIHVHTSGSMPMCVFSNTRTQYGCIYPLQTFTKNKAIDFSKIPFFIEASDDETMVSMEMLVETLSRKIYHISSGDRQFVHLAGVFACNFPNILYAKAEEILNKKGLPFDVISGLIREQTEKALELGPKKSQTGPAARGDENIIAKHLNLLSSEPEWQNIYSQLTGLIVQIKSRWR